MKPTMTIVQYLYSLRNGWLRHHEECSCGEEKLIQEVLDQVHVEAYMQIEFAKDYAGMTFKLKSADEWNEICGPAAEQRVLNKMADQLMAQASEYIAMAATKERLSGE